MGQNVSKIGTDAWRGDVHLEPPPPFQKTACWAKMSLFVITAYIEGSANGWLEGWA